MVPVEDNIKRCRFQGRILSLELDIALAFSGGVEIELIQMLTDRECIYSIS